MPRYTRRFLLGRLASIRQTLKKYAPPGKPSDFDIHSRSATADSGCPTPLMVLRDHVNGEKGGYHRNSVLNLLKDWLVAPTWSSVRPMVLRSNRFRCEALRRRRAYVVSEPTLRI